MKFSGLGARLKIIGLFSTSKKLMMHDDWHVINAEQFRRLFRYSILGVLLLIVAAFGVGIMMGKNLEEKYASKAAAEKIVHDPEKERFAIAKLGELAGRLSRLETDAAYLVKKVGVHEEIARKLKAINPQLVPGESLLNSQRPSAKPSGQGGVLLPPRTCANGLPGTQSGITMRHIENAESSLSCLQDLFGQMDDMVARRNADFMAIPSGRPIEGAHVGSPFGNRIDPFTGRAAFHSGLDFAATSGTPIYAAAGGRVIAAGPNGAYGNMVQIDHGNGLITRYAHLSKFDVKENDVVMPHQVIAFVGSTGRSTGPHLHFEVMHHGELVNPKTFLSLGDMEMAADVQAQD